MVKINLRKQRKNSSVHRIARENTSSVDYVNRVAALLIHDPEMGSEFFEAVYGASSPIATTGKRSFIISKNGNVSFAERAKDGGIGIPAISSISAAVHLVFSMMLGKTSSATNGSYLPTKLDGTLFSSEHMLLDFTGDGASKFSNAWNDEGNVAVAFIQKGIAGITQICGSVKQKAQQVVSISELHAQLHSMKAKWNAEEEKYPKGIDTLLEVTACPAEAHHAALVMAGVNVLLKREADMSAIAPIVTRNGWGALKSFLIATFENKGVNTEEIVRLLSDYEQHLYFVDRPYVPFFNHEVTPQELLTGVEILALSYPKSKIKVVYSEQGDDCIARILMENNYLRVCEDAVYDSRDRRIQNMMVLAPTAVDPESDYCSEDLYYVNSFGSTLLSFLYGMKCFSNVGFGDGEVGDENWTGGKWYREWFLRNTPIDKSEDQGSVNWGDREVYDRFVTPLFKWNGELPIVYAKTQGGALWYANLGQAFFELKSGGEKSVLALAIMKRFGMPFMHKAKLSLFNGDLVFLRWKDVGGTQAEVLDYFKAVMINLKPGVDWLEIAKMCYSDYWVKSNRNVEEFLGLVMTHGILVFSTKVSKATKRTQTKSCYSALAVGKYADDSAMVNFDQATASPVTKYTACIAPTLVTPPGVCFALRRIAMPCCKQGSDLNSLERVGIGEIDWKQTIILPFTASEFPIQTNADGWFISIDATSTVYGDNNEEIRVKGIEVQKGEVVVSVAYLGQDGETYYHNIPSKRNCVVKEIRWRVGTLDSLDVTVILDEIIGLDHDLKLRENVKMTVSMAPNDDLLYNTLNEDVCLSTGIMLVIGQDADKSPDLLQGRTDIAALTARENGLGKFLKQLNAGMSESDRQLMWSEALAAVGHYDGLHKWFNFHFAQSLWFHFEDLKESMVSVQKEAFEKNPNWTAIKAPELEARTGVDFTGKEGLAIFVNNWDEAKFCIGDKSRNVHTGQVLVFYSEDGKDHLWQKCFCYVGTNESHVWGQAKVELSSVQQAVSVSSVMFNTVMLVNQGMGKMKPNPELAEWLMDNKRSAQQWATVQAMFSGSPIYKDGVELPKLELIDVGTEGVSASFTDHVLEYEAEIDQPSYISVFDRVKLTGPEGIISFEELKQIFGDVVLRLNEFQSLYLPALWEQESEPIGKETLNGLVKGLVNYLLANDLKGALSRMNRIKRALRNLAKSSKAFSGLMMGQPGVNCKVQGYFGIPVHKMYILEDARANSYYQCMARLCIKQGIITKGESIDGVVVLGARAPMPFPGYLEIEVVKPGSAKSRLCTAYQPGVNCLFSYINKGDYDGDGVLFVPVPKKFNTSIQLVSLELIADGIFLSTGKNWVSGEQKAYIKDHWEPKVLSAESLSNFRLLQAKHIAGLNRFDMSESSLAQQVAANKPGISKEDTAVVKASAKITNRDGFAYLNKAAAEVQANYVGWMYQMAVKCTVAIELYKTCESVLSNAQEMYNLLEPKPLGSYDERTKGRFFTEELVAALFEIYEGGTLGGYDPSAYLALGLLIDIIQGKSKNPVLLEAKSSKAQKETAGTYLKPLLNAAGLNGGKALQFFECAKFTKKCRDLTNPGLGVNSIDHDACGFIHIASEVADLLGRGKLFRNKAGEVEFNMSDPDSKTGLHFDLVAAYFRWQATYDLEGELRKNSVVIKHVNHVLWHTLCAILPSEDWVEEINNALCTNVGTEESPVYEKHSKLPDFRLGIYLD